MKKRLAPRRLFVLKIESYQGSDTYLQCGNETQDYLFCIVATSQRGHAEIVDSSYRSLAEALEAWPEARPPEGGDADSQE